MKHIKITITGLVQGVFFRHHTREKAQELHLTGYVCNRDDGSVFIEAEGDETSLNSFLAWCSHGPDRARVENVDHVSSKALGNCTEFSIRSYADPQP